MIQELEILTGSLMIYNLPFYLKDIRMTESRYIKILFDFFLLFKWYKVAAF